MVEVTLKDDEGTRNAREATTKMRTPGTERCVYVWRHLEGGRCKHPDFAGVGMIHVRLQKMQPEKEAAQGVLLCPAKESDPLLEAVGGQ